MSNAVKDILKAKINSVLMHSAIGTMSNSLPSSKGFLMEIISFYWLINNPVSAFLCSSQISLC